MPESSNTSKANGLSVTYSSWFARLFLKSIYDNQWVIPEPLPKPISGFLKWYEQRMNVDTSGIEIDRPIFIISLPRCGSSMLQDLLCTHPQLAYTTNIMDICRPSCCAAEHLRKKFGVNISGERFLKDSVVVDGGSPADPVATWADFFGEDYFEINDQVPDFERLSAEQITTIRESIKRVLWSFGGSEQRFFCKTPMLLPYLGVLNQLFPDAKFIHLLRDPRQGANSMVKIHKICNEKLHEIRQRQRRPAPEEPFIPYPRLPELSGYLKDYGPEDVRTTAHLWNDAIDTIDTHREHLKNFYEIRYEDILAAPAEQMAKLFDFCELPQPGADNSAFHEKLSGVGVVHHTNRYGNFQIIEDVCRTKMQRFSYLNQ